LLSLLSDSFAGVVVSTAAPGPSPAGTVTFLFTDIEGSTRLWETEPSAMARSPVLHNETLHAAFEHHGGVVFSTMGRRTSRSAVIGGSGLRGVQSDLICAPQHGNRRGVVRRA